MRMRLVARALGGGNGLAPVAKTLLLRLERAEMHGESCKGVAEDGSRECALQKGRLSGQRGSGGEVVVLRANVSTAKKGVRSSGGAWLYILGRLPGAGAGRGLARDAAFSARRFHGGPSSLGEEK
jgi:hypothetical protein